MNKKVQVLLLFAVAFYGEAKLPPAIRTCSRNEKNLADCILKSVALLQPSLIHGNIGAGFQIPPLEPFLLDSLNIDRGQGFRATFKNLQIKGASNFAVEKLRVNLNDVKIDFIVNFPRLDIKGKYDLDYKLFGFDIKGQGDLFALFGKIRARITMRAVKYPRNGQTFLKFENIFVKIKPRTRSIKLANLFQGNEALEEIGNSFINGNSEFFESDIYPGFEEALSVKFTSIVNKLTGQASFDELFPDI